MHGFVYRLFPPRPTFSHDMTEAERTVMGAHVAYWTAHAEQGRVLAFGPVDDPTRPYGFAIVLAETRQDVDALRANDPAVQSPHGFTTDICAILHLVTPSANYPALHP